MELQLGNLCDSSGSQVANLLKSVANDYRLRQCKVKKTVDTVKGEGYFGVITYAQMTGSNDSSTEQILDLVIKTTLKGKGIEKKLPVKEFFEREIFMYDVVMPSFHAFLRGKSLPPSPNSPKCYKTTVAAGNQALVLENIKINGYKMWDRQKPMNQEHIVLAMKEYGRLHALSFAMKDQQPARFEKVSQDLDEIFVLFLRSDGIMQLVNKQIEACSEMIKATEGEKVALIHRRFVDEIPDFLRKMSEACPNYSVVTHGDCWSNNVMFKYGDPTNDNSPTEMSFLDFQASRLGPPVFDLAYFFHVCASREIIDDSWRYLDLYYSSLRDYLNQLGSNVNNLYPYDVFKQQWKQYAKFGLIMAALAVKVMLREQREVVNFVDLSEAGKSLSELFTNDSARTGEYNERMRHLILYFIKNNLI